MNTHLQLAQKITDIKIGGPGIISFKFDGKPCEMSAPRYMDLIEYPHSAAIYIAKNCSIDLEKFMPAELKIGPL